jgi:hypothetical protein
MPVLQDSEVKTTPGKEICSLLRGIVANIKIVLGNAEQAMTTNDWA